MKSSKSKPPIRLKNETRLPTLQDLSKTTILVPDLTKEKPCQESLVPENHFMEREVLTLLRTRLEHWRKLNTPLTQKGEIKIDGRIAELEEILGVE